MAVGDLNRKISSDDKNKLVSNRNHGEYEEGFEDENTNGFVDWFDSDGDGMSFDDDGFISFDDSPSTVNSADSNGMSNGVTMNGGQITGVQIGGAGVVPNQQQTVYQAQPDTFDKILDAIGKGFYATCNVMVQSIGSVKVRTADDWGYYSTRMIKLSGIFILAGILLTIVSIAGGLSVLGIAGGLALDIIMSALLLAGTGLCGIGLSAIYIEKYRKDMGMSLAGMDELEPTVMDSYESYESDMDDVIGNLYDDWEDEEDSMSWLSSDYTEPETTTVYEPPVETPPEPPNLNNLVGNIEENRVGLMNRELLVNTFKPFFPKNTVGFSKKTEIENGSDTFSTLETLALKALANAAKIDYEDMMNKSKMEEAFETFFTYELRMLRVKGLTKMDDIEREMVAYFRDSSEDTSVSCKCDLEGDFYKLTINKGNSAIVTLGDIMELDEVDKFIRNTKNKMPFIAGLKADGRPILTDAKTLDSMLIAGKPRSGKSWYVLQILITLMAFNSPETVQFLIIDPKSSNMFNTMSLMPHVCGLHTDENIMKIMSDVIDIEGARRKKLLADNKCENIWQLRDKGIEVPILYIVIDEVMTVLANLSDSKEFFELVKVIVTQLPSQGIRLMMVPHRSSGVVDKTVRMNIPFITAIKAANEVVLETLGLKKWTLPLEKPGDMALYIQGTTEGVFARGPAVTPTDEDNNELMLAMAKSYYKMGIELPDMTTLGMGYNRDNDKILEELHVVGKSSNRVQFSFDNVDINEGRQSAGENLQNAGETLQSAGETMHSAGGNLSNLLDDDDDDDDFAFVL